MKLFFSKVLLAFCLLTTCLNAQQASDQVMPETGTELAVNFEAISTEVADSLEAKAKGDPVFAKDWMISVANPHAAAAGARVQGDFVRPRPLRARLEDRRAARPRFVAVAAKLAQLAARGAPYGGVRAGRARLALAGAVCRLVLAPGCAKVQGLAAERGGGGVVGE